MSNSNTIKAYISYDWVGARVSGGKYNASVERAVNEELEKLQGIIVDGATWSSAAQTRDYVIPCTDVIRNTREIEAADVFIAVLIEECPERAHWGTGQLMAFAVGKGKPCYIICHGNNVLRKSHFSSHPLIRWFESANQLLEHLKVKIAL